MKALKGLLFAAVALLSVASCKSSKSSTGKLYRALRRDLVGLNVTRVGDSVRVVIPEQGMFDFNQDMVKPEIRPTIVKLSAILNDYKAIHFNINGYTDNVGTDNVNADLSRRRAEHVRDMMIPLGVANSRMSTSGRGAANPMEPNSSDAGRAQNRRVEFMLYMPKM